MALQYNPLQNDFQVFEAVETPQVKLESPFSIEPLDISDWAYSIRDNGTIIAQSNLPEQSSTQSSEQQQRQQEDSLIVPGIQELTTTSSTKSKSPTITFEELIKQENLPIRITSGYRGKGDLRDGKTASGKRSNHNRTDEHGNPMAYDISPTKGYTFDDLRKILYKNPRVVEWFKSRGWGILEEMQDGKRGFYDTEGKFHYTGATGPHFHIGPDSFGVKNYNHKISKGKKGLKIDSDFTVFEPVEVSKPEIQSTFTPKPIDLSDWADSIRPDGTIIAQSNLPQTETTTIQPETIQEEPTIVPGIDELKTNSEITKGATGKTKVNNSNGAKNLSRIIDEVSKEKNFEGLQDPEIKRLLMLQAQRESDYDQNAKSSSSTASGYFQMLDGTRKHLSSKSKEDFLNDPKEQVRAAYKLIKEIHNMKQAKQLAQAGYNKDLITALGWWYPRSMQMLLDGQTNFSLGGYSIKKALKQYG